MNDENRSPFHPIPNLQRIEKQNLSTKKERVSIIVKSLCYYNLW